MSSGDSKNSTGYSSSGEPSEERSKPRAKTWSLWRSESFFLALLFALVALLLPTFFSFATPPKPDETGMRDSPLKRLFPYIPTVATVFRMSLSILRVSLRPLHATLSVILALFAPVFLAVNLLYQSLVLLPSRVIGEVVRFLYPIYLFCGVACLFGAGVGLGGRLLVEGSKILVFQGGSDTRKGRRGLQAL